MKEARPNVLLLSIDALKPEFVAQSAKLGINLPNLSKLAKQGAYASKGVKSVFPTFTYPCHQSIITGTNPSTHGIHNNLVFDPDGVHQGAWNWFANENVPTLWESAKKAGYCVASSVFPTSVGARGDYIVPEYWRDGTRLDQRFLKAMCNPQSLGAEIEKDLGSLPSGLDLTPEGDEKRKNLALWLLNKKLKTQEKPYFLTAYLASYDEMAHAHGTYSDHALAALEKLDCFVGEFMEAFDGIICVVSDHGTLDVTHCIHPNVLFYEAGLIEGDKDGKLLGWRVWNQRSGGTSEVRLKDNKDETMRHKVSELLNALVDDPESGVEQVLIGDEARELRHGFDNADFVIVAKRGHEIRDEFISPYKTGRVVQKAQHGFSEEFEEMRASFYIMGEGIAEDKDIGELNLIDIAPTLAELMGVSLPSAEGISISSALRR